MHSSKSLIVRTFILFVFVLFVFNNLIFKTNENIGEQNLKVFEKNIFLKIKENNISKRKDVDDKLPGISVPVKRPSPTILMWNKMFGASLTESLLQYDNECSYILLLKILFVLKILF
uniref:Uncharacterized protein n=1 Tax=Meloidogyne enterolobii TaxID=390850 RepID=A0A6V7TJT3_MELEN|nr:unnamed protein product [Meloidogyne enterolobii]